MKQTQGNIIFTFLILILVFMGLAAVSVLTRRPGQLYQALAQKRTQERTLAEVRRQEALRKNDTYGGSTPEETFALFLEALRAGDTDLASKYFVLEKQEEWETSLQQIKDRGNINNMINDLSTANLYNIDGNLAWLNYKSRTLNGTSVDSQIALSKNSASRWKINVL